jgi:membrane protease YdiL (CAAX protease family)
MILVVGTSEEILFRGFLQKGLVNNLGNTTGIFITAIIFASIHLLGIFLSYFLGAISLGLMIIQLFIFFFPYLAISLLLGYIFYWRNENLIAVVITHGLYNSLTILIAVVFFSSLELTILFISVLIFMGIFPFVLYYFLDKYNVKRPLEISA